MGQLAASPSLSPVVSLIAAVNAGNVEAVLAHFGPNMRVIDSFQRLAGANAVRDWVEVELARARCRLTLMAERVEAGRADLRVHWRSRDYDGLCRFTLWFDEDGQVRLWRID
jgi:hypothetical protein